jgi:hypothetical protein
MPGYFVVGRVTSSAGALGKPHDTCRHEGGLRYRLEIVGTAVLREVLVVLVPCTRPDIKHCMGDGKPSVRFNLPDISSSHPSTLLGGRHLLALYVLQP